jgi:cation:H+ antiporter
MFFFLAAAFYAYNAYFHGSFSRVSGIVLLAIFMVYMILTVKQMRRNPEHPEVAPDQAILFRETDRLEAESHEQEEINIKKSLIKLAVGAALIASGADLLVDNGIIIAETLGVPESVIGLTFVALGTSLPELVTAVTALLKGHGAMSIGNIIGANLFNLVLVSGISIVLAPFDVPQSAFIAGHNASLVMDIPVMVAVMLILTGPAMMKGRLYRIQGIVLMAVYSIFCIIQFTL